jgi:asparagine synthase (glutamine-hydrolysing)
MKIIEAIANAPNDLAALCSKLVRELDESVERNMADGILLSGGLDTSVLAYLASKQAKLKAFTAALQNAPAPDIEYATLIANRLGLKHLVHRFDEDELREAIPVVVKAMDSFDPMEIRNSVTVYIGLKCAKENGVNAVMTGDGCDELFAGYSFLYGTGKDELNLALQKLWDVMHFSSVPLAKVLKMEVKLPYLDPEFKKFAMGLDPDLKVRNEKGQTWGKWILRKAFENVLPPEVIWRVKTPIEFGSGTAILPGFFSSIISDAEFNEKRAKYLDEDKVTIRDKEQLFYYEVYRSVVGPPRPMDFEGKICPFCNSGTPSTSTYCRRCGGHPI